MNARHVAVWIDHKEARVFHVGAGSFDVATLHAPHAHLHRHPKGAEGAHDHPDDAKRFFHDVARALDGADEILVVGPSTAKLELVRYLQKHDHLLEAKIVGVETVDHPSDGQLVDYVKRYFRAADRMR